MYVAVDEHARFFEEQSDVYQSDWDVVKVKAKARLPRRHLQASASLLAAAVRMRPLPASLTANLDHRARLRHDGSPAGSSRVPRPSTRAHPVAHVSG